MGTIHYRVIILLLIFLAVVPGAVSSAGTETLVSTGPHTGHQESPSAYGDYIVWTDSDGSTGRIMLLNASSGELLLVSDPTTSARYPRIQGTSVVWIQSNAGGSDVYHYDISSGITTRITDYPSLKRYPVIYGDKIVWQEREAVRNGRTYYDLQLYELGNPGQVVNITPHPGQIPGTDDASHEYPSIWGDYVVWEDWDDLRNSREIFLNDTATGTLMRISDDTGAGSTRKMRPAISGSTVVWVDDRNGDPDIFSDTVPPSGNTDLTPYSGSVQDLPALYGDRLIWLDNRGLFDSYQIAMNNLSAPSEVFPITSGSRLSVTSGSAAPSVFSNRVVWQDARVPGSYSEVYLYTDGVEVTCPVASFTRNVSYGSPPLPVRFTDTSSPLPLYRVWDFGDGALSLLPDPEHTYSASGTFPVLLTVGTPYCRNATWISAEHNITVGDAPVVGFSAAPLEGLAPLTVTFTDASSGLPESWNWSFGDGTFSEEQNPTHIYTAGGIFPVRCNATNDFGTGSLTQNAYITVLSASSEAAFTNITGLTILPGGAGHTLVYDTASLPEYAMAPGNMAFSSYPPSMWGWQNITFVSDDGTGFVLGADSNITGTVAYTNLTTKDIVPSGFSPAVGHNVRTNFRVTLDGYQEPGWIIRDVWEGSTYPDYINLINVYTNSNYASMRQAYTVNITREGLGRTTGATINMSVGSAWLTGTEGIDWERDHAAVIAVGYDQDGELKGTVLPARYLFNDSGTRLEYFEADIPYQYLFLNKYTLATLSGSGNPLQLITLSVTSHANQQSNTGHASDSGTGSYAGGQGSGQAVAVTTTQPAPAQSSPALPSERRTAKVYTSPDGIVSQATELVSADGHAILYLGTGIIAKNSGGDPLAELWIESLPNGNLPEIPPGSTFTFAGLAYEIGPDGAVFSPPLTLTLPVPSGGNDYSVKWYDRESGSWLDLPATSDPAKGTVTAELTHLCTIALFAETPTAAAAATPAAAVNGGREVPQAVATPPATAVSVFANMTGWVIGLLLKNVLIVMGILVIAVIAFLVAKRRSLRWEE